MRFWLGTTDPQWFSFLSRLSPDEVNFWQPSVSPPFKIGESGMPFLFKLKSPFNAVAGGGFFIRHSAIPIALAWEIFGKKNGADSLKELIEMLGPLKSGSGPLYDIGCQVIANPIFLPRERWLLDPKGWSSNIVRGKMYESEAADGKLIWDYMRPLLNKATAMSAAEGDAAFPLTTGHEPLKYGREGLLRPRLGQGAFRLTLTELYKRRCAITGESTLPVLEAAHIVPYGKSGTHDVRNGLLLRADFHKLFDVGLVSVAPDMTVRISPRIREAWSNGKVYNRLSNQPLAVVPDDPAFHPNPELLDWHMRNVFQG